MSETNWNDIFNFINQDDLDDEIPIDNNFDKNLEEIVLSQLDSSFEKYFNDYCTISYLEDIKDKDVYLINKWKYIFHQCVTLDDLFYKAKSTSKMKKKEINKSFTGKTKNIILDKKIEDNKVNSINIVKNNSLSLSKDFLEISSNEIKSLNSQDKNTNDSNLSISNNINNNSINSINSINKNENENLLIKKENKKNKSIVFLNEFKLKDAKESIEIYDNEKMSGDEFELNSRRILNLMMIFIGKHQYRIFNPKKIPLSKFIKLMKINLDKNIKITDPDNLEIDVIINNFQVSHLKDLINKFKNHFFLTEKLKIDENNNNINIIGEISRNFIFQIKSKFEQIEVYNIIFKILENLKNNDIEEEIKNYIISKLSIKNINNDNIFLIITDGSFIVLSFVIDIIKQIEQSKLNNELTIKKFIEEKVNKKSKILIKIIPNKYRKIKDLIYKTYLAFKYLDDNHFRYCVLFLGDKSENSLEGFYKTLKEKPKKNNIISYSIKNLINDLLYYKDSITNEIEKNGKIIKKNFVNNEIYKYNSLGVKKSLEILSNKFYIDLNIYCRKKINIDKNKLFNIDKISVLNDEDFKKRLDNLSNNIDSTKINIYIIKDEDSLQEMEKKPYLLYIKEKEYNNIYNIINTHFYNNYGYFRELIDKKVKKKIKELNEKKNDCTLNLENVIQIFNNENDFRFDCKALIELFQKLYLFKIEEIEEEYILNIINNKKNFEKELSKEFNVDFTEIMKKNFVRLKENIIAYIYYDFILIILEKDIAATILDKYISNK